MFCDQMAFAYSLPRLSPAEVRLRKLLLAACLEPRVGTIPIPHSAGSIVRTEKDEDLGCEQGTAQLFDGSWQLSQKMRGVFFASSCSNKRALSVA